MGKLCDNTSVGQEIWRGSELLMIDRAKFPHAFALPAGHLDGDVNDDGIKREVMEEVGLTIVENEIVFPTRRIDNRCKREGGSFHDWTHYCAKQWTGEVIIKPDEVTKAFWASIELLERLAKRTEYFMFKYNIPDDQVGKLTGAIFGRNPDGSETDPEWKSDKGLEPVWYYIFRETCHFDWLAPTFGTPTDFPAKKKS